MTKPPHYTEALYQDARIQLRISTALLAGIEKARGDVALSVWIRRALVERLEREAKR